MIFIKRSTQALFCLMLLNCGGEEHAQSIPNDNKLDTFLQFHSLSEQIYDGEGTWGQAAYGYRMALRDSYWRMDVYAVLQQQGHEQAEIFAQRVAQVADYLMMVQSQGETGVFGFPADPTNPEFGARVADVIAECSECVRNGWIVTLPDEYIEELYYDHGYALASIAKIYPQNPSPELLAAIIAGAEWILDKPLSDNINYISALSKGLCYAYSITGNEVYLDKSVELHEQGVFPFLLNGQAIDEHNSRLEYHGFIVSGLVALRRVMPDSHPLSTSLNQHLSDAVRVMAERGLSESAEYGQTWPGTNLLAWYELEQLRTLSDGERVTLNRIVGLVDGYAEVVETEVDTYRFQKSLYSYFFIGLFSD